MFPLYRIFRSRYTEKYPAKKNWPYFAAQHIDFSTELADCSRSPQRNVKIREIPERTFAFANSDSLVNQRKLQDCRHSLQLPNYNALYCRADLHKALQCVFENSTRFARDAAWSSGSTLI